MTEPTPDSATCERWFRWWNEARTGNEEAKARLLGEVRPFFKRVALTRFGGRTFGPGGASDVVQECCLKLTTLLPDPELPAATGQEFRSWLQAMALNECRDALRAGAAQKRGGDRRTGPLPQGPDGEEVLAADASTPSGPVREQEEQQRLREALGRLPA